jgi:hypothetical protein
VQHLCAIGQKTAVKIHQAEKTLQLFDVLRGWAKFNFGSVTGYGGLLLPPKSCGQEFPKRALPKKHFSRLMARPVVAKALKKASK